MRILFFIPIIIISLLQPAFADPVDNTCIHYRLKYLKDSSPSPIMRFKFDAQNCQNSNVQDFTLKQGEESKILEMQPKACHSQGELETSWLRYKIFSDTGKQVGIFDVVATIDYKIESLIGKYYVKSVQGRVDIKGADPSLRIISIDAYTAEGKCAL